MTHGRQHKNGRGSGKAGQAVLARTAPEEQAQARAYHRLLRAQTAWTAAQDKVARLRVKLDHAEGRLVRRAEKLDRAQRGLVTATRAANVSSSPGDEPTGERADASDIMAPGQAEQPPL